MKEESKIDGILYTVSSMVDTEDYGLLECIVYNCKTFDQVVKFATGKKDIIIERESCETVKINEKLSLWFKHRVNITHMIQYSLL